ncbi:hypothetical protein Clacol_001100 [Clathrus columnatus]|uniref:Peptidase M24 domain-containing protein n=1 Tax=Clathrus columnatus TaxID=1419009 RepID=A0AAV5A0U5_9AGAM|nr:hypothetical protein Clacol_001100 [Clathrus columnatus]
MSLRLRNSSHLLQKPLPFHHIRSSKKHVVSNRPFWVRTQSYSNNGNPNLFGNYDIILPEEPFVYGVKHIPVNPVPPTIPRPPYTFGNIDEDDPAFGDPYTGDGRISLGGEDETKLKKAASIAKSVLGTAKKCLRPGVSTQEIDSLLHNFIISHGAYPSPLGYAGFPKSCCTSVNNIIVHGIPDSRPLCDGDIVNIDVTVYMEGFHGDTSDTFPVGNVVSSLFFLLHNVALDPDLYSLLSNLQQDQAGLDLIRITREALKHGIMACGPNRRFSDIGRKISDFIAPYGYSINDQFTGHGIGKPAIVQGTDSRGWLFPDGWTVSTESGARSAQAEHTILITDTGVEVLT